MLRGSPLGRGILTGSIKNAADLPASDSRAGRFPRFAAENLEKNVLLVRGVERVAAAKGCTPGQVALAWVLARGQDIVPIPGTKRSAYLEENLSALDVQLTPEDVGWLDEHVGQPARDRYADMRTLNR
jgi:aryl-alcohol dehydrogenase-like predicted oxidoreductase